MLLYSKRKSFSRKESWASDYKEIKKYLSLALALWLRCNILTVQLYLILSRSIHTGIG